jgi:tRNA-dihydrouridine synthase B
VKEMYRSEVHYDYIARAAQALTCPVLANGNVYSAKKAQEVLDITRSRGLMIGRGVIRNPWLFYQIRQHRRGEPLFIPTGHDVLQYIRNLFETVRPADIKEYAHVQKMKKYLNYVGLGVEPTGQFLHQIRRVSTEAEFFNLCEEYLSHDRPMPLEPFSLGLKDTDVMAGEHL